jgi:mitogen-activated protein kinase kinase kinase 3
MATGSLFVFYKSYVARSADLWSLGCTIIEMAALRPPWALEFPEPAAAMFHIASTHETPQIPEHLSPEAHDFLIRCFKR